MKEFIKETKGIIITLVAGICAIICVSIFITGLVSYKQTSGGSGITVTGSASCDFTSDLIVWRGSFTAFGETTKEAYDVIKRDSKIIKDYLLESGVAEEEIIFYSVNISQEYGYDYNDEGNVINEYPIGYKLYQEVSVSSPDVDKIESVSRDITKLIDSGVEFASDAPEYYYTKMDELKLELIDTATKNATARVDIIAKDTNSRLGKLLNASLGVFQITARNSDSEEYSYGGTFNTSAKEKTATITVRLDYSIN